MVSFPSLRHEYQAAAVLCLVIPTLFTLARLGTKRTISPWALEDYTLMVAWVFKATLISIFLVQLHLGLGRYARDIPPSDRERIYLLGVASQAIYCVAIWVAKTALLLQLSGLFTPTKRGKTHTTIHVLIWGNLAFYVACIFVVGFQCVPIRKVWNHPAPGYCINLRAALITSGALNSVSDLVTFLLPISIIRHLQMPLKRKIGFIAIFATGSIAIVASVFRTISAIRMLQGDELYAMALLNMWTATELAIIILCTCLPMIPAFFKLCAKIVSQICKSTNCLGVAKLRTRLESTEKVMAGASTPSQGDANSHIPETKN